MSQGSDDKQQDNSAIGSDDYLPSLYLIENWNAYAGGATQKSGYEVQLFSDARIAGEIRGNFGPYTVLNGLTISRNAGNVGESKPAMVLRVFDFTDVSPSRTHTSKSDDRMYHGGGPVDEISALLSLMMGIRIKPGEESRLFYPDSDPLGIPISATYGPPPTIPVEGDRPIIPSAIGYHNLTFDARMGTLRDLSNDDLITLIRAARLYQDALWLAEGQPALSWLLFVSALETVALRWTTVEVNTVEKLQRAMPQIHDIALELGNPEFLQKLADALAPMTGSTTKFLKFLKRFAPGPPSARPRDWCQIDWQERTLQNIFSKIYDYRSKALHTGKPFPSPMCMPAERYVENEPYAERPHGISWHVGNVTWTQDDVPMSLHTFEYITRTSILSWWDDLNATRE